MFYLLIDSFHFFSLVEMAHSNGDEFVPIHIHRVDDNILCTVHDVGLHHNRTWNDLLRTFFKIHNYRY